MKPEAKRLRELARSLNDQSRAANDQLKIYESTCNHNWGETVYSPIYHEAYTVPGDPPGTMGVDWRGPVYVPAQTEERWKRECNNCGKVEYTEGELETVTKRVPKWRTR
jgi:hypothetical protein